MGRQNQLPASGASEPRLVEVQSLSAAPEALSVAIDRAGSFRPPWVWGSRSRLPIPGQASEPPGAPARAGRLTSLSLRRNFVLRGDSDQRSSDLRMTLRRSMVDPSTVLVPPTVLQAGPGAFWCSSRMRGAPARTPSGAGP